MTTLSEQFNNHVLSQTINNKLNEIEKIVQNTSLNDQQKESAIAYQLLLQMVLTTLKTKSLPIIPKSILDNLNNSIINLSTNVLCDINSYYSQYQNLIDWYNRLPRYEKKSEVKESFNTLITNFVKRQDAVTVNIEQEIESFKEKQQNTINDWDKEKESLNQEINGLKQENINLKREIDLFKKNIAKQEERLQNIVTTYERDFKKHIDTYDQAFLNKTNEQQKSFDNLLSAKEDLSNKTLEFLEKRKNEVEHLWGIIGQAAISGNSQNYANKAQKLADKMMWVALGIMIIVALVLAITTVVDLISGTFNYLHFAYKIIGSTIFLVPSLYCSNISKRHRDREFQLRDFEVKTAALEPFLENMNLERSSITTNEISKDKIKLELTKTFFDKQFDNGKNDCVLLPKEIAKILNAFAKKCNLNINLGNKEE